MPLMTMNQLQTIVSMLFAVLGLAFTCSPVLGQVVPKGGGDAPPRLSLPRELNLFGGASGGEGEHLKLSGSFTVEKGGRQGILSLAVEIDPTWHIYSLTQPAGGPEKSQIKVTKSPQFELAGIFTPDRPPHVKPPEVFKVNSEEHAGAVTWSVPIEVREGVDPESLTIEMTYSGQVCKDGPGGMCIPIFGEKVTAKFAGYTTKSATPGEFRPDESQGQVVFKGHIEPAAIARGGKAKLVITAEPNPGWHIYAYAASDPDTVGANKPTLIQLAPLPGWKSSPVKASVAPKQKPALIPGAPAERSHSEPVSWTTELTAPADSPEGEMVVSGFVGYQTCDDKSCLPPQAFQFRASLPVKAKAEEGKISLEFSPLEKAPGEKPMSGYKYVASLAAAAPAKTERIDFRGLAPMLAFGLLGGLILNLMPCVLPVIGLKLLSFVQHGGQSRARIFSLNLWFALGLLSVFMVLATAAAFANLGWGQQFTYTWFKVAMVVVVFAFALSFLGVWEVPIPGFAQSGTSSKLQHHEGPSGAFFKGVFTTLLATPCSGPFLGPVFAFTLAQPPLATYLIFASVGLGMASPYLLVGAFPALVRWLPKPGEWMETVKQLMGFVLLGTVVYLFSTINSDYFIPTLALMMAVWLACWIIGRVPLYESAGLQIRNWAIGVATAAAIGWAAFTFLGPLQELIPWQPYSPEALAKLQADGKTVMVDFTADWCLTCQFNTRTAINTRRVKEAIEKHDVVPLLADWTDKNDAIKEKLAELNSKSIPLLAIYPASAPFEPIVLRDALVESQVLSAIEQAGSSMPAPEKHQISTTAKPE
jgi:suppressor for copper-sensitivity B